MVNYPLIETVVSPDFPRPSLSFEIVQTGWKPWYSIFRYHHYLHDAKQMPFSTAFTAFDADTGDPAAFVGVSGFVAGRQRVARACRLVVHPEYQGAGIGLRFLNTIAEREARGEGFIGKPVPCIIHTAHPALCAGLRRSKDWKQVSQHIVGDKVSNTTLPNARYGGHTRSVAGFRFLGVRS